MSETKAEAKREKFFTLYVAEKDVPPTIDEASSHSLMSTYTDISEARGVAKVIAQNNSVDVFVMQSVSVVRVQSALPPPTKYERL